ncbi:hypothetical protein [Halorientalis sp.]|uniref:hypothetical protein n=1 Tax=Halorientalis sp. TaxID=1931229 RepID=UPI002630A6ED|nr:hypothetical protein [Halorientalis sp.]
MSRNEYDIHGDGGAEAAADSDTEPEQDVLRGRIELLQAENERLRTEYARAKQARHRRTALGLAALGVVALVSAALFASVRTVLIAIGSTGLFGAVLLYYLTPERFVAATVGTRVYESFAGSFETLVADLGLSDRRVYVPVDEAAGTVRLFVPQAASYELPGRAALEAFVVTDDDRERGLAIQPTGHGLFEEFEQSLSGSLATEPAQLGSQLIDALIEQFELVDAADVEVGDGQLTVALDSSVYGDLSRFDHPVVSLLAVGVARGLGQPVVVDVNDGDDRFSYLVTLRWEDSQEDPSTVAEK